MINGAKVTRFQRRNKRPRPGRIAALVAVCIAACVEVPAGVQDGGVDGATTGDAVGEAGPCRGVVCATGFHCHRGRCVLTQGPCGSHDQCLNDTRCVSGQCVPYGPADPLADPACTVAVQPFAADELLDPVTRCSWTGGNVLMTPVVGDLSGDGLPEIVLINAESSALVAIHGATCKEWFNVSAGMASRSQLALGDLTGDKVPEVVGVDKNNRVVVRDASGKLLATSKEVVPTIPSKYADGGPALADLDGTGGAEIVLAGLALRYAAGTLSKLFHVQAEGGYWGALSAVADVDLDGVPEVVVGNRILDGLAGKDQTPKAVAGWAGGYVAVAQFDAATAEPEVVLVSSPGDKPGTIRIYHPVSGKVVFGPYTTGPLWGGPPTVADFDGDGAPEVGVAGYDAYLLFDPGCAVSPLPADCHQPGVRWRRSTQDVSSGSTGSAVFDFNGDGRAEVVYRDECWLRVYDGATGQTRLAASAFSGTILDMPVVADVDVDGHGDLVLPSTAGSVINCKQEQDLSLQPVARPRGVHVLQDPKNRWMASRPLWNQHTYHITNVNDDLTIPAKEPPSWASHNSYRQNVQGAGQGEIIPGPDLTARATPAIEPRDRCLSWTLRARICNRGASWVGPGVAGTFYRGDPRGPGASVLCSGLTASAIDPGTCALVTCVLAPPPATRIDLWFVADRDAAGAASIDECREGNNLLHLPGASCGRID